MSREGDVSYRIELIREPDADLIEQVYREHREMYRQTLTDSPLFQGLHLNEMTDVAKSSGAFFILGYKGDEVIGHCVVTTDMSPAYWLSPEYFEAHFNDHYLRRALYFVTAIGVREGAPSRIVNGLIDRLCEEVNANLGIAIADFRETSATEGFARYIAARGQLQTDISWWELGSQRHYAFETSGPRDEVVDLRAALAIQSEAMPRLS